LADFTYDETGRLAGVVIETPEGPKVAALTELPERHTVGEPDKEG
jgi:hypothetical protein